jgi:hypothetical protein
MSDSHIYTCIKVGCKNYLKTRRGRFEPGQRVVGPMGQVGTHIIPICDECHEAMEYRGRDLTS